jgi:DNA-binding NarL/FixJ family response regulator
MAGDLPTIFVTGESRLSVDILAEAVGHHYSVLTTLPDVEARSLSIEIVVAYAGRFDGAAALVRRSKRLLPQAAIVVVGGQFDEAELLGLIEMGASACVPDDSSLPTLREAIDALHRGQTICSQRIASVVFARVAELAKSRQTEQPSPLTARERMVYSLVREGLSNKEIAQALSMSVSTVKNHVHHILTKLKIRRRDVIDWDTRLLIPLKREGGATSALP